MKILLINDYAAVNGGAELVMHSLLEGLRSRGHEVRLFASTAGLDRGSSAADETCFGTLSRFRTLLQTANVCAWAALRQVLKEFRPDVVHVTMFLTQLSPLILPPLRKVPTLHYAVWQRMICPTGFKLLRDGRECSVPAGRVCLRNGCVPRRDWLPLMIQGHARRRWGGSFDRVVSASEALGRRLVAEGIDVSGVVWSGVPVTPERPPLAGDPLVSFSGRIVPAKGLDLLIRAFATIGERLPTARLLVVGEGPDRGPLMRLADDLGVGRRIEWTGFLPRGESETPLGRSWVHVVPSRMAEPFGMVAAEAMMRGTAVVGGASGGLTDFIQQDESGLLVPTGQARPLAEAVASLLSDRDRCERLGSAGRRFALERLSDETMVDAFLGHYRDLVEGSRQSRHAAESGRGP